MCLVFIIISDGTVGFGWAVVDVGLLWWVVVGLVLLFSLILGGLWWADLYFFGFALGVVVEES